MFSFLVLKVADQHAEARKTEDALIEAGASFVEAIVESEEDLTSIEQIDTQSSAAAIAAAEQEVASEVGAGADVNADDVAESASSGAKKGDGLFWADKPVAKVTHAQKDIEDLLMDDEPSAGVDDAAAYGTLAAEVQASASAVSKDDHPQGGGGSLTIRARKGRKEGVDDKLDNVIRVTQTAHQVSQSPALSISMVHRANFMGTEAEDIAVGEVPKVAEVTVGGMGDAEVIEYNQSAVAAVVVKAPRVRQGGKFSKSHPPPIMRGSAGKGSLKKN